MDKNDEKFNQVAHIALDGREQSIDDHAEGVGRLAEKFASAWNCGCSGYLIGKVHDVGKTSLAFGRRLHGGPKCDHSSAGAYEVYKYACKYAERLPSHFPNCFKTYFQNIMLYLAMCVAGHHSGLLDLEPNFETRMNNVIKGKIPLYDSEWSENHSVSFPESELQLLYDRFFSEQNRSCEEIRRFGRLFWTRMQYSCLVDADYLDTEAFMSQKQVSNPVSSMSQLFDQFQQYCRDHGYDHPKTKLNCYRTDILRLCLQKGTLPQGLYSLTVPTGGGKTIASLGFALRHAQMHQLDRIIYVIPYTSIIEQTAETFRAILGDISVLEYHSGYVGETNQDSEEQSMFCLSSENWDVPVVVTTSVQFFESLYANSPSKCRKLHNIAKSVVIFDEAQLLPIEQMEPCIAAIAELVNYYSVTVVLCTATCPDLNPLFQKYGLSVSELGEHLEEWYDRFRRVMFELKKDYTLSQMAEELLSYSQVLCIVNLRKHARALYDRMKQSEGVYHLSTLMTPMDRKRVLNIIRERLASGKVCRVVSTSLIEAGVDVDFPRIYRELDGIDSILQAAGRCNREGKRSITDSKVTIFTWSNENENVGNTANREVSSRRVRIQQTRDVMRNRSYGQIDDLEVVQTYFHRLYDLYTNKSSDRRQNNMDTNNVLLNLEKFPFQTIAANFHMIEDHTKTIYIPCDENRELLDRLRYGQYSKELFRRLALYGVNVYKNFYDELCKYGAIEVLNHDIFVLNDQPLYDSNCGLSLPDLGQGVFM